MKKYIISSLVMLLAFLAIGGMASAASPAKWMKMANFGGNPTRGAVWFTLQGAAYVISGMDEAGHPHNQCWKYDPTSDTWTRKADFPGTPIIEGAGFALGTKGYVTLGSDNNMASLGYPSELWEYDPVQDSWTKKTSFKGSSRAGMAVTTIGRKAYLFAGGRWPASTAELWEYDPSIDAWTQKADCPGGGRLMPLAFTVGSKGYFGLGKSSPTEPRDLYEYDPAANTWTRKADYPGAAFSYAIGMSVGNKAYVGTGISSFRPLTSANDVWEYDPAVNAWTRKPDLDGDVRSMAIGFVLDGHVYFGLGHTASFQDLSDIWRWDP